MKIFFHVSNIRNVTLRKNQTFNMECDVNGINANVTFDGGRSRDREFGLNDLLGWNIATLRRTNEGLPRIDTKQGTLVLNNVMTRTLSDNSVSAIISLNEPLFSTYESIVLEYNTKKVTESPYNKIYYLSNYPVDLTKVNIRNALVSTLNELNGENASKLSSMRILESSDVLYADNPANLDFIDALETRKKFIRQGDELTQARVYFKINNGPYDPSKAIDFVVKFTAPGEPEYDFNFTSGDDWRQRQSDMEDRWGLICNDLVSKYSHFLNKVRTYSNNYLGT